MLWTEVAGSANTGNTSSGTLAILHRRPRCLRAGSVAEHHDLPRSAERGRQRGRHRPPLVADAPRDAEPEIHWGPAALGREGQEEEPAGKLLGVVSVQVPEPEVRDSVEDASGVSQGPARQVPTHLDSHVAV